MAGDDQMPTKGRVATLPLRGRLTINEAEQRRSDWLQILSQTEALVLDTGALEEIDAAGLQLLLGLRASGARAGKPVRLAAPATGPLLATLARAGFCDENAAGDWIARDRFWRGEG